MLDVHEMMNPMLVLAQSADNSHAEGARLLLDLLAILATAAAVAALFRRLHLGMIPGYVVAGAIVGPHAFGLVQSPENVENISRLAVILLMFTIGLMLEARSLRSGMISSLAVGVISTVATVLLMWPVGLLFGSGSSASLAISMAIAMSSTAVLMRVMQERRELRSAHGRLCLAIAIAQDLLAVVMLAAIPLIARVGGVTIGPIGQEQSIDAGVPAAIEWTGAIGRSLGAIIGIVVVGYAILPRVLNWLGRSKDGSGGFGELLLLLAAATGLGAALATGAVGFSPEMGAFLAGFMLSLTPFRHQIVGQLQPMRDLLLAVFFTGVGLTLDPTVMVGHWAKVALGVIVVLGLKSLVIGGTAWVLGAPARTSVLSGVYLSMGGEFSLVVLASALAAGLITPEANAAVVSVIVITLVVGPLLVPWAHRLAERGASWPLAPWIRNSALREAAPEPEAASAALAGCGNVVIAGFGPVGRHVAEQLERKGVPITVIELNPSTVRRQTTLGRTIVYGDVANPEVLESAGVRHAEAVIITVPDEEAVLKACRVVRELAPAVFIAARTSFLSQALRAREFGADYVTVEEIATGDLMARDVLDKIVSRRASRAETHPPDAA